MIDKFLYRLITLPARSKAILLTSSVLVLVFSCGIFVYVLSEQSRAATQASQTAVAQRTQEVVIAQQRSADATQQVHDAAAATSTAIELATAQAQANANSTSTAIAFAPFATQTAVIVSAGPMPASADAYLYSDATSHSVSAFASLYTEMGAADSLGFPVTELFIEQNPTDGRGYWVQYFEKGVIQHHSETNEYHIAPLGVWRFSQKYPNGAPPSKPLPSSNGHLFAETNHTVNDPFLQFWIERGQVRRFGYPISESFEETSEVDGKTYIVQYFERAVMEYHPELQPPHNVQLTALGSLRHTQIYPSGAPMSASNPIPSPTPNATKTAIAVANATATAIQVASDATATAMQVSADATAMADAKAAAARATAETRAYDSYRTTAPSGTFSNSGDNVAISFELEYQRCISYWCAEAGGKFILVGVAVNNIGYKQVHVNPLNFTLVSTDGATVAHDSSTYALGNYLDAVDIEPGTYTNGWIAFLTNKDFIPGRLVWNEIFGERVIVRIVEPPR
jgi:hypothetical protein